MNEQTLAQHLEHLERENRRLKRAGVVALAVIAAAVLMGQAKPKDRAVEAEKFLVRDKGGKLRAELGVDPDGSLHLAFYDMDQKPLGGFNVDSSGTLLALTDKDQRASIGLGISGKGSPGLAIKDKEGKLRTTLVVAQDGSPRLTLLDKHRMARVTLSMEPDGSPVLGLNYKDGKTGVALGVVENDTASLVFSDRNGKFRTLLGVAVDTPTLTLYNETGKVIWSAP